MVICLERGADLHMAQLMPLPLTVSCFSKVQIGFTFLVPAHPGSPRQRAIKRVCVCVFPSMNLMSRMYICRLSVKLWQMSSIKRIGPRLQSMAFKMKFQDLVNEIKPVCLCDTLVILSDV